MRRWIPLLAATLLAAACIAWDPVADVGAYVTASHPEQVRVTLANGGQEIVYAPRFADSSLVGSSPNGSSWTHVQIPMAEVKRVEVPTTRAPNTSEILWVVAGVAAIFAATKVL